MKILGEVLALFLLTSGSLFAEQATHPALEGSGNTPDTLSGVFDIFQSTGLMAYPLLLLSVVAVFLVIFYIFSIRQGTVVSDKFMQSADVYLRKEDYLGLLDVCDRRNEALARVTEKTLEFVTKNPAAAFEEAREVAEAEGSRQASLLTQRISYLADVGSIAPMVGLLGTVIGMIRSFREIGAHVVMGDKTDGLAAGVSEALFTTAGGLVIGIPSLIFYSVFRGRVQRLISDMETATTHIVALLGAQYNRARIRAAATRGHVQPAPSMQAGMNPPYPGTGQSPPGAPGEDYYPAPYSYGRTIDPEGV